MQMDKNIFLTLVTASLFLASCNLITDNDPTLPTVTTRPDETIEAGCYTYLYVQDSTLGDGLRLTFIWEEHPDNPERLWINEFTPLQRVGFTETGVYKFSCQLYNGFNFSNTDSVFITAVPRTNPIFEDPHMDLNVRYKLNLPTGELTLEILSTLTSLHVLNINSIAGIENCTNLSDVGLQFNMAGHNLTDISPLLELTKLTSLSLGQLWGINDLSILTNLTQLLELKLTSINLSDYSPVNSLVNLQKLEISNSEITNTAMVANSPLLTQLDLSFNKITNIDELEFLQNINKLDLTYNEITNIKPLYDNQFLKDDIEIRIPYNPLDSISVNEYIPALRARGITVYYF